MPRCRPSTEHGTFFAPRAFEIDRAGRLDREVFGPILHVVRWPADRLDAVLDEIDATGYGLTLGIHSRIDETVAAHPAAALRVGNSYVNRNMIGAVVGVQPFGGERPVRHRPEGRRPALSPPLRAERTVSIDTTAAGGNAACCRCRRIADGGHRAGRHPGISHRLNSRRREHQRQLRPGAALCNVRTNPERENAMLRWLGPGLLFGAGTRRCRVGAGLGAVRRPIRRTTYPRQSDQRRLHPAATGRALPADNSRR